MVRTLAANIREWKKILLVCAMVALGAVLAYQPHFDYPFPLLGDEYNHISFGKYILEEGALPFQNPYLATLPPIQNFESGFHFLLAFLFLLIPGDPVLFYKFLVVAAFALNAFLLFCLVRLWFKSYGIALLSVFFFGTIKSEAGMLAHQYFLPLSFGITLLLLSFIFFHLWMERRRRAFLLGLIGTLAALALSYPPALFFFFGTMLVYGLSMAHSMHEFFGSTRERFFWWLLGGTAALSTFFVTSLALFDLLGNVVFPFGWNAQQTHYSPIFFFGVIPSAFALVGLYATAVSRREYEKIALFWFLFALSLLSLFYLFNFNVLIPAPRLFFFYLIGVSILAGIGAAFVWRFARKMLAGRRKLTVLSGAMLGAVLLFHYSVVFAKPLPFRKVLTPEIYDALIFLKNEYPVPGVVIADSVTSHAVYPVSGKYIANLLSANVGGGSTDGVRLFLSEECRDKVPKTLDHLSAFTKDMTLPLFLLTGEQQKEACQPLLELLYAKDTYLYRLYVSTNRNPNTYKALAGHTLKGKGWVEYFEKDGSIRGRVLSTGSAYAGTWQLSKRPAVCGVYPSFAKDVCKTFSLRGDTVLFFELGGALIAGRNAVLLPDNPYGL